MPKYKIKIENNNLEQIGKAVITTDSKIEFKRTGIKGLSNFIENNFYNISFINIVLDKFDSKFFAAITLIQDFSFFSDEIKVERRKGYFQINYNGFEFVFAGKNMGNDVDLMWKDTTTHKNLLSKEEIDALEKISKLFPLIAFQKMNFKVKFKRTNENWFELEHRQEDNNYFLEGNEDVNLYSKKSGLGGKFIYEIRCKSLDKICFENLEGYMDSKILIESEKEKIQFQNEMKYLSYAEKKDNFFKEIFFNLSSLWKNVEINFDFNNKKFYFQDVIDENEKIRIVRRIKEILKKFLNFSGTDELEKIIEIFEIYLAKFESEKVDERIEMIKDFKI